MTPPARRKEFRSKKTHCRDTPTRPSLTEERSSRPCSRCWRSWPYVVRILKATSSNATASVVSETILWTQLKSVECSTINAIRDVGRCMQEVCLCIASASLGVCYISNSSFRRCRKMAYHYPTVVLVLVWANALRCFTSFDPNESFDATLISKLVSVSLYLRCAVSQTSVFIASRSGQFYRLLVDLRVTAEFAENIHGLAGLYVVACCCVACVLFAFQSYIIFAAPPGFNFILTPLVTHIPVTGVGLIVTNVIFLIVLFFITQSWWWPKVMNQLLAYVLWKQFRIFNNRFYSATDKQGKFNGDLRVYRARHQALSLVDERGFKVNTTITRHSAK